MSEHESLLIEDRSDYVYCRYTGAFRVAPMLAAFGKAAEHCRAGGSRRILMDLTEATGEFDMMDRFSVAKEVSEVWDRDVRMAVLGMERLRVSDNFGETVARNRGVDLRVFFSLEAAVAWLTTEE